jgi:membrane fusion protein, macrolide-specific efflux system
MKKIFLLTAIFIIFVFSGCSLIPKEEEVLASPLKVPPKITYDFIELKKGTIEQKVECTGYFISVKQSDLSFKNRSGRLKAVYVTVGDKVKKGDLLAELYTDELESQIKQQTIILQKTQMFYDAAVASEESNFNIKSAELNVELEKIKLDDLQRVLSESKMFSPIEGTIDYVTDARQGEYIDSFRAIARVADPYNLQLQYTGDNITDFELGMKVSVKVDDAVISGSVVATPSNLPRDVNEEIKKQIRIKLDKVPGDVEIGNSADITLMLAKKENVDRKSVV